MITQDQIDKYYKNPRYGLLVETKMKQKLKEKYGKAITNQEALQLFKDEFNRDYRKKLLRIDVKAPFVSIQIDFADMRKYYNKRYNPWKYLLVVIDVYSRYIWVRATKSRKTPDLVQALKNIFHDMLSKFDKLPKNVTSDNEFNSNAIKTLRIEYGFNSYYSAPGMKFKSGMVERVIRTLRNMIKRYVVANKTTAYVKVLQDIAYNYNNTIHRSIGIKPVEAINMRKPRKMSKEYYKMGEPHKNIIGKYVRLRLKRDKFAKGDTRRWSKKIYQVVNKIGNRYQVKDINTGNILDKLYNYVNLMIVENKHQPLPQSIIEEPFIIEPPKSPSPKSPSPLIVEPPKSPSPLIVEPPKSPSPQPLLPPKKTKKKPKWGKQEMDEDTEESEEDYEAVMEEERIKNVKARKLKQRRLEDRQHQILPEGIKRGQRVRQKAKLKKLWRGQRDQDNKEIETYCDMCNTRIKYNQVRYRNEELDIDLCSKCYSKHKDKTLEELKESRDKFEKEEKEKQFNKKVVNKIKETRKRRGRRRKNR